MEEVLLRSDTSKLEIEKQTIPCAWEDQGGLAVDRAAQRLHGLWAP